VTLLRAVSVFIAVLVALPLVVVLSSLLHPETEIWLHLWQHVLPDVLYNTLFLLLGVLAGVLLLGVSLAWLVSQYEFPGRRVLVWALVLPLAMPAYVMAFVQVGLLDFTGPLQTVLREYIGQDLRLPEIRSLGGAILVLSLSFYPYVYLLARNAFNHVGQRALEVGQSLGLSPLQSLWRVALPLARPWIVAGALLALMETLADFGAVYILGVDTFTTAIYKAWFGLFSLSAAAQLASLLILVALLLMSGERWQRGERHYQSSGRRVIRRPLYGTRGMLACFYALVVLGMAFIFPLIQLLQWVMRSGLSDLDGRYIGFVIHSIGLASLAAIIVYVLALLLSWNEYQQRDRGARFAVQLASVGYAVPGSVLAVGVFVCVAWLDNQLVTYLPIDQHSVLKGSVLVLLLALACRFLSVALSPVSSAFNRIGQNLVMAARSLGEDSRGVLQRVYLPLLRGGSITALLLVFVDVMKEMPITLMTRPFGWDTLAIRVFEMTSEGEWQRAALPAVMLVLAGLLPVIFLIRSDERPSSGMPKP